MFIIPNSYNSTKKSLKTAQTKGNSNSKELSRLQHDNNLLNIQMKKTQVLTTSLVLISCIIFNRLDVMNLLKDIQ